MSENTDFPLISVVITGRNEQSTIEDCILSILDQSHPNFELIYIDAQSSDNTLEKAKSLKNIQESRKNCKRYIVISRKAVTPGIGRNYGVTVSSGSIIAFTDADCIAEHDWLENLIRLLSTDDALIGGPNVIRHKKKSKFTVTIDSVLSSYIGSGGSPQFYKYDKVCHTYAVSSCNMAIQKNLFEKVGGFNELLRYNEDSDLCVRLRKIGYKIVYTPFARVNHFLGIESYKDFVSHFYIYGSERGKNVANNSRLVTKFNILSLVTIAATIALLALSFSFNWASLTLVFLIVVIALIIFIFSLKIAITNKSVPLIFTSLAIFLTLQAVYNFGFIWGYLLGIRTHLQIN